MKIKKGDTVKIITGKDKGKEGKVTRALPEFDKVIVDGLNLVKKHVRPKKEGDKGQIVQVSAPLQISNVMLICPNCSKATRVAMVVGKDGRKLRKCKKCNKEI